MKKTLLLCSAPATSYQISVLGFTSKREGSLSDAKTVRTDTAKPSPPIMNSVNCTGDNERKYNAFNFG